MLALMICLIMLVPHTLAHNHTNHTENWSPFHHSHWVYHEHDGSAHYHHIHHAQHHAQNIFYIVFQDVYKIMPFSGAGVFTQSNYSLLTFLLVSVCWAVSQK